MNRILIDTNVILRYLLDDVEEMALIAEQIIEGGARTTPEVLAEMTYVLETVYGFSRKDICAALNTVFIYVEVAPYDVVGRAIRQYEATELDFVDFMMIAYATENNERVLTFDKGINRRLSEIKDRNANAKKP